MALPIMIALAGCGTGGGATTTTITATTTTTGAPITTSRDPTTTAEGFDAAGLLSSALESSGDNYRFISTVTLDESEVTTISGIVDGLSVSADIIAGDTTVSYIRTEAGEWATGADGEWSELEGEPPVSPPLSTLEDAAAISAESLDVEHVEITGTLGAAAGANEGLEFFAVIRDDQIVEIRYETQTSGHTTSVLTSLADFGSAGTVSPPT